MAVSVREQLDEMRSPSRPRFTVREHPQGIPAYQNESLPSAAGHVDGPAPIDKPMPVSREAEQLSPLQGCHAGQAEREIEASPVGLASILQDLQDLQAGGYRVSMPRPQKRPAELLSGACGQHSAPAGSSSHQQLPQDRSQAALEEELVELERSGLKVRRR